MALLLIGNCMDCKGYAAELNQQAPDIALRFWPDDQGDKTVRYALAWHPPVGGLAMFPNLKVIFCTGAGVEHILRDPGLPSVPVARFIDPNLTMRMTEYVCLHVLMHQRRMIEYAGLQKQREWKEIPQPGADEIRVGIMGLGVLGQDSATKLASLGFQVAGWSRTPKSLPGIDSHSGEAGQAAFLARTDILVALLPLTPDTKGILNNKLFTRLARDGLLPGPVLINAGRGGLQVEGDILAALETGMLWAASLDVFETEPLPAASPLWAHPRVIVTPHTASISDYRAVCRSVLTQITRIEAGGKPENVVDILRGY